MESSDGIKRPFYISKPLSFVSILERIHPKRATSFPNKWHLFPNTHYLFLQKYLLLFVPSLGTNGKKPAAQTFRYAIASKEAQTIVVHATVLVVCPHKDLSAELPDYQPISHRLKGK